MGFFLAFGSSVYTAFLFGQAEGRDFWQTPVFPFHLIVQSFLSGSAVIILISPFIPMGVILANSLTNLLLVTIVLDLLLLWSEFSMSHASEVAARAAKNITQGEYREIYWWGAIFCGHFLPFFLLSSSFVWAPSLAVLFILGGLYCYEHVFVMAPQKIPNS